MNKNRNVYLRFADLTFHLHGWIPPANSGSFVNCFLTEASTADYDVFVYQNASYPVPTDAVLLQDAPFRKVWQRGSRYWTCLYTIIDLHLWNYAVFHFDARTPQTMQFQIFRPECIFSLESILSSIWMESLLLAKGKAVLHAATISYHGKAVIFSAPSGTGKSTQAELWHQYQSAEIINGDRIALLPRDGELYASGLPFSGSSDICKNRILPVRSVVFLSQAKENSIEPMRPITAIKNLTSQISVQSWRKEDISASVQMAEFVFSHVPVYHLACLPDFGAVETLKAALDANTEE